MEKNRYECPLRKEYPSVFEKGTEGYYMKLAYNEAIEGWKEGEVPVGAVAVYRGEVVGSAHNRVEGMKDGTAHAEILAMTMASRAVGDWRLNEVGLYVTKEPCPMCAGALVMNRVGRVVYGVGDLKMGFMGGVFDVNGVRGLNHRVEVVGGVMEEECREMLRMFFQMRRGGKLVDEEEAEE